MTMSVAERARVLATFRFIEVRLMEIAAAWTPVTPEMEVKVMLGRHIWDFAQHADALGKRTFEQRQSLHYTLKPLDECVAVMDEMAAQPDTRARLEALYQGFLPGLEDRYRQYVADADAVLDAPSVVIVERILLDIVRQRGEAEQTVRSLGLAPTSGSQWRSRMDALGTLVAPAPAS